MQPSDSTKVIDSGAKEKSWADRNKAYLNALAAQKKLAEDKQALHLEQEQRKKAKLRRQVLGASFDRLYPRASARGEGESASDGDTAGDGEAVGKTTGSCTPLPLPGGGPVDDRCGSPSTVPKLPPLAEQQPESVLSLGAAAEASRRPNPLTRSVSLNSGGMAGSLASWGAGSSGGVGVSASASGQRVPGPARRRRATLSNPSGMNPVQEDVAEAGDAADDEGPDQALGAGGTRRRERRAPGRTQASPGRQAALPFPGAGGALLTTTRSPSKAYGGSGSTSSNFPVSPSGLAQWRQRMKVPEGQRVFCISGTGNHSHGIRAGLVSRGWFENPEHNSPFFDYKWSSNPLDIAHEQLWPGQTVNHFKNAQCLTTKHGLCHTVREMVWWEAADAAAFYPRAYDISDEAGRREFFQDVRWTAAESLIKRALLDGAVTSQHVPYTGPPKKSGHSISSSKHGTGGGHGGSGAGGSAAASNGGAAGSGHGGAVEVEGAGATAGGGEGVDAGDGGNQPSGRLQQRTSSDPLVDLPSLRLACRVIAARLRQQRHLRVVIAAAAGGAGSGAGAGGGTGPSDVAAPAEVDLSPAQWQQLVRHRALFCSAPLIPPPDFDHNWVSSRRFITSIHLPRPEASGAGSRQARRDGKSLRRKHGKSQGRSPRVDADAEATQPAGGKREGEAGAAGGEGERGQEAPSAAADGGASGAPSRGGGVDGGAAASSSSSDVEDGAEDQGDGNGDARGRGRGRVVVADAAELLREVAAAGSTRRRRHSAPAAGGTGAEGGGVGSDGGDACAEEAAGGASAGNSSDGGSGNVVGGGADGGEGDPPDPSWLPTDLPAICYDDAALQALDHGTWREAAEAILAALSTSVVQTHISGTNNIWIVKPAGKSRGRGIRLFNDPEALLQYTRGEEAQGLEARWVAQKYVERPLIIWRRKFDIRQWVLVTDWNPLCVWFYSTCYLRFAASDYDPNNLDIFQHLTNNSVAKYYEGPLKEDEITANGNMWSIPRFQTWLEETYGRADLWQCLLQPAMKHVVICTLKCAQDLIAARKGSCQLYGYDFLIDDQLRVWLLEINSSPTLESSTPITTELCADVQEDILRVTVDLPDHLAATAAAAKRRGAVPSTIAAADGKGAGPGAPGAPGPMPAAGFDTGKWECIVDGGEEMKRPDYTGLNLELKGTAIPVPSPARSASTSSFVGRLYAATRQGQTQNLGERQQQAAASPGKTERTLRQASPPGQPYQPHQTFQQHQQHHHSSGHGHGTEDDVAGASGAGVSPGGAYAAAAAAAVRVYAAGVTGPILGPAGSRAKTSSPMRMRTPRLSSTNAAASPAAPPAAAHLAGPLTASQLAATWDGAGAGAALPELAALGAGNLLASLSPPSVLPPGTPLRLMTPRGDTLAAGAAAVLGANGGVAPGPGMEPLSPLAARASLFSRPGMR